MFVTKTMPNSKRLHIEDNIPTFFDQVLELVPLIPVGRVTTYGAIARFLGSASSARMVGWALNSTKTNLKDIPAHRVVNRTGTLTGKAHFNGIPMAELLQREGITVKDDQIQEMERVFWDPALELQVD